MVEVSKEIFNSLTLSIADCIGVLPSCIFTEIDSLITMALSTSIPKAIISAASET